MKKISLVILFVVNLVACSRPQEKIQPEFKIDFAAVINADIDKLTHAKAQLKKTVFYGGEKEIKHLSEPVWKTELRPFLNCNVQTPAFDKLYSSYNRVSGDSMIITYVAQSENSEIRSLELVLLDKHFASMKANLHKKNSYFTLDETLEYQSMRGYTIRGSQKMMFAAETVYFIHADILLPS